MRVWGGVIGSVEGKGCAEEERRKGTATRIATWFCSKACQCVKDSGGGVCLTDFACCFERL
jgi:hypothetical protein